jgi:hypothetical protein
VVAMSWNDRASLHAALLSCGAEMVVVRRKGSELIFIFKCDQTKTLFGIINPPDTALLCNILHIERHPNYYSIPRNAAMPHSAEIRIVNLWEGRPAKLTASLNPPQIQARHLLNRIKQP